MDLRAYRAILKRWWWLLCICVAVATGVAAILSIFVIEKVYESKASIIIKRPENVKSTNDSYLPSSNLIKIYYNLMVSETVIQDVKDKLQLTEPLEDVRKFIRVDPDFDTGILQIITQKNDAELSTRIAMALIDSLKSEADSIELNHIIHIIDTPKLAEKPVRPKPMVNMALSFVSGGMLGLLLIILANSMDQIIKDSPVLKRFEGIPVLGRIPRFKPEYIKWLRDNKQIINHIDESYKILRAHVIHHLHKENMKVILITSTEHKEGKTLTAAHLAASMVHLGQKVLLMDADFKSSDMQSYFKLINSHGLTHYYFTKDEFFEGCSVANTELDVISDGLAPTDPTIILDSQRFNNLLIEAKERYDLIVIDGSSIQTSAEVLPLSQLADGVIVVTDYKKQSYEALQRTIGTLQEVGAKIMGFVVNKLPYKQK